MKVAELTGSTSYSSTKVMSDAGKLMFKIVMPLAAVCNPKLSAEIKIGGSGETICKGVTLSKLFEFSQNKEGFVRRWVTNVSITVIGYVDLTETGAIPLNDSKFLELELTDCTAGTVITIFAKSSNEIANTYFEYNRNDTAASVKSINLMTAGKEYLLLDKNNLEEIKLTYETGRNERLTTDELIADADDNNDIVSVETNVISGLKNIIYGSDQLFIIGLTKANGDPNVVAAELNTTGSSLQYMLVDSKKL